MNSSEQIIAIGIQALKDVSHILPDNSTEYVPDVTIVASMLTEGYQQLVQAGQIPVEPNLAAKQVLTDIGNAFASDNRPHMSQWFLLASEQIV